MVEPDDDLTGLRVLVVEDTALVAETIVDVLDELGCIVVGPAATLEEGEAMARSDVALGCALLDIHLGVADSFPIADVLRARQVPFAFLTGFADEALPSPHQRAPCLAKPFQIMDLMRLVAAMMRPARG